MTNRVPVQCRRAVRRSTISPSWCAGYVEAADIGKHGACHMFRHTMATLMLEGGADTRFIQAMLGHADLKTTQIYTHVAIRQLQEIHRATHPAKLSKDRPPMKSVNPDAADVLAALDAENDEDPEE